LHIAYCILYIAYCILHIAYCILHIAYCILHIAYCILHNAYCILHNAYIYDMIYTTYCRRVTTSSKLLVAQTSFIVWEMRRGVSRQNYEHGIFSPLFLCWAKCLFQSQMGVQESNLGNCTIFFRGVFFPEGPQSCGLEP
jgi:hypothetical protein